MAAVLAGMAPPERMSLPDWADEHFVLVAESSSEPGPWTTLPFQRGWMEAMGDPDVPKVTVMKSARVGYTKSFAALVGYHAAHDPCSMLILQPTDEDAKGFSDEELDPMFRDVEVLAGRLTTLKSDGRGGRQTLLKKRFPGGMLTIAGARSPKNFRRITVRAVLRDEIDAYEATSKEGDPITLSAKRVVTASKPKEVNGSTPTLKHFSRIEREFQNSDQRFFMVPCPHCGTEIRLVWNGTKHGFKGGGIKWPAGKPEAAYYECQANGCVIEERDKAPMVAKGRWVATAPFKGHAGFHISALYSPFPGARWGVLAQEFIDAKRGGAVTLQPFINTVLGETWDAGESFEPESLRSGAHIRDYRENEMPGDAVLVTAGVDIQDDRFEIEFVGWEPNHNTWSLDYKRVFGDPSTPEFWCDLEEQLQRTFTDASGRSWPVEAACVDSGGHYTDEVYAFTRTRFRRRVYAVKGSSKWDAPIWPSKMAKAPKKGAIVFEVGVNAAKMKTYLRMQAKENEAGFCFFPMRYGEDYFEQLTAEKLVRSHSKGFEVREFRKDAGRRNEAWDCRIYATVARESVAFDLHKRANERQSRPAEEPQRAPQPAAPRAFIERRDDWLKR